MSLGPVFVKCSDGYWYENPLLGGKFKGHRWFLCVDERDPVELVLEHKDQTFRESREMAKAILIQIGLHYGGLADYLACGRLFEDVGSEFVWCHSFLLSRITTPFPVDLLQRHDGVFPRRPHREGTYFDFEEAS